MGMKKEVEMDEALLSHPFVFAELVDYQEGSIVSRTVMDKPEGTITVFAFDQGQNLSEHTAPFDALIQVVEGTGIITIDGLDHTVDAGQAIIMPADIPHAVSAGVRFKMMLTMIRAR